MPSTMGTRPIVPPSYLLQQEHIRQSSRAHHFSRSIRKRKDKAGMQGQTNAPPGEPASSCSDSPPSASPSSQLHTEEEHAAFLESIVHGYFDGLNSRLLDRHPSTAHFAPDFISIPDYTQPTEGITAHFDGVRRLHAEHPNVEVTVQSLQAHINLRAGYGEVYAKKQITGCPTGVVRTSLCVLEFRLRQDRWTCVKYTGMRGMNDHPGPSGGTG